MSDTLTRADVERIAALARLQLSETELSCFAGQLSAILQYAEQIQRVDTTGVEPVNVVSSDPGWRDDTPQPSLNRDLVLDQAPAADLTAGLFKVPRVLGS